jgi:hypothetical protein
LFLICYFNTLSRCKAILITFRHKKKKVFLQHFFFCSHLAHFPDAANGCIAPCTSFRVSFRRQPRKAKRKFVALITDLLFPGTLHSCHSLFTTTAKIAHRRDKKSRLYKRAVVFFFLGACPALTFFPARAVGCLHGNKKWCVYWRPLHRYNSSGRIKLHYINKVISASNN